MHNRLSKLTLVILSILALQGCIKGTAPVTAQADPSETDLLRPVQGTVTTSWIGNSIGTGANGSMMQYQILGLYVAPDGTCYANTNWLDADKMAGVYKDGRNLGFLPGAAFGKSGGTNVVGDGQYLYYAHAHTGGLGKQSQTDPDALPAKGSTWYGIRRVSIAGLRDAQFSGGKGNQGNILFLGTKASDQPGEISGQAVDSETGTLYASDDAGNVINVVDTHSMSLTKTWKLGPDARPLDLTWDSTNHVLWAIVQSSKRTEVWAFNSNGQKQPLLTITLADKGVPSAILAHEGTLYVGDDGPDQNIKLYEVKSGQPALTSTLGVLHGVFGGAPSQTGYMGPWRFDGITGLGIDARNNLYVASFDAGSCLESYNLATHHRNWILEDRVYVDLAAIDPKSPQDAYSADVHFHLNWNANGGGSEFTSNAVTKDRFLFPADLRFGYGKDTLDQIFYIQGHRFLAVSGNEYVIGIYRFDPAKYGQIAVPCSIITNNTSKVGMPQIRTAIWTDANGDGAPQSNEWSYGNLSVNYLSGSYFDDNGSFWFNNSIGFVKLPASLDSKGTPGYRWSKAVTTDFGSIADPDPIKKVSRMIYDAASDTMYVLCATIQHPTIELRSGTGDVLKCITNFSTGPTEKWQTVVPVDPPASLNVEAIAAAGKYIFVQYLGKYVCAVYRKDSGEYVGSIAPDKSAVGNMDKIWVDQAHGINAVERPNGEYDITDEDDIYTKTILFRWTPAN